MADKPAAAPQMNPVIAKLANRLAVLEIEKANAEAKLDLANQVIGQQQAEIARLSDMLPKDNAEPPEAGTAAKPQKTNGKGKTAHA